MAILLYLFGFGISFALGEIEVTGFQFEPLNLLARGCFSCWWPCSKKY